MKKIKILLVGYGPRGRIWSKVIKKNTKVILIGICDINKDTKKISPKNISFFTRIEKAVLDVRPDAIILCTPPFKRMQDLKICAKYKLPVLVEKPLAVNLKEAINLVNFMSHKKLLLFVGLNFRYFLTSFMEGPFKGKIFFKSTSSIAVI